MARREFTEEEKAILKKIISGEHPSPGSGFLGWKQEKRYLIEKKLAVALLLERLDNNRRKWIKQLSDSNDT